MEKYTPEVLFGLMHMARNIALIVATAWTVVNLYKLSGSWHSLWALLMLAFLANQHFIRD